MNSATSVLTKIDSDSGIAIKNLRKTYGEFQALKDVSLEIQAGEFISILGPSGSGKTTFLRILAGMVEPDAGTDIRVKGRSLLHVPMHKRNIGMVFQSYALFPHLNVFANIAYPLRMRGYDASELESSVRSVLELVDLNGFEKRLPRELSGGQAQRVALARALVFNPDFLLLDEPLAALDRRLKDQMQFQLRRIHDETGITMVSVTHDQTEAMTMSDRIALFSEGCLVQVDRPIDLYRNPNSLFAARFLGETNVLPMINRGFIRDGLVILEDEKKRRIVGRPVNPSILEGPVSVAIRSESVLIAKPDSETESWNGVVKEAYFQGDSFKYIVYCDPHNIICKTSVSLLDGEISIGDMVSLRIDPDVVKVLDT